MICKQQRLLGEALELSTSKFPDKTVAIHKGIAYSYQSLKKSADNFAHYLVKEGIKKGDRIAIFLSNSWQSAVSVYGTSLAGGVFLVINPDTKAEKLRYILNDCSAKMIISESKLAGELSEAVHKLECIEQIIISGEIQTELSSYKTYTNFEEIIQTNSYECNLPLIIPTDLAALIYTSGSTGFPKGVMMTHQSMVFTSWSLIEYLRLTEEDRILLVIPLAFDYGLYQLIMAVTVGGTIIIENSFNFPPEIFKQIELYKPTVFPAVPSIYSMMITMYKKTGITFESINKITNTAAALPVEFINELKEIFPNSLIFKMYGLTECKRVCYLEPELIDVKTRSVGKAIPGTEVLILSEEGTPVAPGDAGTLYVRGPHVMSGYWNNEELSNKMLKPGPVPGERMLCAQDLFKMDEDGFLYFLGRNDDIIKTRGEKVSPVEVENVIYKIEGVKEVAIIGIPDAVLGESIIAYVTTYNTEQINEKEIRKECLSKLESFMVPQKIILVNEMPKSSNGKIDKAELKKLLLVD